MADTVITSAYLGLGINSFTGEHGIQTVGGEIKASGGVEGTSTDICKTEEEVFQKLNLRVDAEVNYSGFDIKGQVDLAKQVTQKTNTTTVLVVVEKSIWKTLTGPTFKAGIGTTSAQELVRVGGDSYLSRVREGARYVAAYSFTASSEESKMNLDVALEANYKDMFKLDAHVSLQEFAQNHNTQLHVTQRSYGGIQPGENMDVSTVLKFADEFAKAGIQTATLLDFETSSYNDVPGAPSGFDIVQAWTRMYKQPTALGYSLATIESQASIVLLKYQRVINLYQFYGCSGLANGLEGNEMQQIKDMLNTLREWRGAFRVDKPPELPRLKLEALVVPKANFKLQDALDDSWIGKKSGGHSFNLFEESFINEFKYLKKILAYMDDFVFHRIEFTIAQVNPMNPFGGDTGEWTLQGQGTGTETSGQATFRPGEVTQVVGWWYEWDGAKQGDNKNCVSGLAFETRSGEREIKTVHGYGRAAHTWKVPENHVFVGFRGNAGTYVDGLLPQAVQFFHPIMYPASMKYGV